MKSGSMGRKLAQADMGQLLRDVGTSAAQTHESGSGATQHDLRVCPEERLALADSTCQPFVTFHVHRIGLPTIATSTPDGEGLPGIQH